MLYYISLGIFLLIVILALYTKWRVKRTMAKYMKQESSTETTAKQMADSYLKKIKEEAMLKEIGPKQDNHYNPTDKSLNISYPNSCSLTALGVVAHELGHFLQHINGNPIFYLQFKIVHIANFLSQISLPIFLSGFITRIVWIMEAGLIIYCVAVFSVLITLSTEIDASKKALNILKSEDFMVSKSELKGVREVLFAAGLTYLISPALAFLFPFKQIFNY